jgi:hypothetical protein
MRPPVLIAALIVAGLSVGTARSAVVGAPSLEVQSVSGTPPFQASLGEFLISAKTTDSNIRVAKVSQRVGIVVVEVAAKPREGWFVHLDHRDRIWVCDGDSILIMVEETEGQKLKAVDVLDTKLPIPMAIRQRLPMGFRTWKPSNVL